MILRLALKSLRNRKLTVALTVLSVALSVLLLLGVERVRDEARGSFTAAVSGTDLIVGARSSPVHLLLYSVFHVGNATNALRWDTYLALARRPEVAWAIPLSLGDSHRGYRVVGTTTDFFRHYRYADGRALRLAAGTVFSGPHEAVIGADVARQLRYAVGGRIVLAHGAGEISFIQHDEHPFRISGVLMRTGTPLDRAVHVSLDGMAQIHQTPPGPIDPLRGALRHSDRPHASAGTAEAPASDAEHELEEHDSAHAERDSAMDPAGHAGHPEQTSEGATVTAVLLGLRSRSQALSLQRALNESTGEPLTALLPGVTLQEIWEMVGTMERMLYAISALVVLVGLAGMLVALLTSLNERRREMAVLRAIGARPVHVFALILGEAAVLTLTGIALGMLALQGGLLLGRPWLEAHLGLFIPWRWPSLHEVSLMAVVAAAGILIGLVPAYRTYRYSLTDGLSVRA